MDVPLETKKTSTAIHLNPGKEVSYEANLTFDNAVLGDNKEEVKKTAPGCQELVGRAKIRQEHHPVHGQGERRRRAHLQ
ncbi:hypothetical protein JCM18918_3481 [Cutibacterium acnes JCM 18918]|nr:hypothetical protein JCM18918_3481 [Cutibacterium acnes JCM 18918]